MIRITLAVMLVAGCTRTWHYRSLRSVADEREMFVITDAAAFELVDVTLSGAAVTGTAERAWTIQRGQLVQPQQGESPDEVAHRARWSPVAADHGAITFRTSSIRYAAVPRAMPNTAAGIALGTSATVLGIIAFLGAFAFGVVVTAGDT